MATAPSPYSQLWRWEVTQAIKDLIATGGGGGTGGGIPEAPNDGKIYGRSNTAWKDAWASPNLTGTATAPTMSAADSSTAIATTAYVNSKLGGYAPLVSPAFIGFPTAPDQSPGDNDQSIANTKFVTAAIAAANAGGPWAPLDSPALIGNPTSPTPATTDNDSSIATTQFVKAQAYLTDAPNDGLFYGRKGAAWSPVVSGGVIISDTAPSAINGQLWWESDSGNLYIYYTDADSSQFVMIASGAAPGGSTAGGRIAGEVATFAMQTAPSGWLIADGALVSRTLYPALFTAIGTLYGAGNGTTTFQLPDLRGEFIRGWDGIRGVDASRVFGSAQAADFLAHSHTQQGSFTTGYISVDHSHTQSGGFNSGGRSAAHSHSQSDNLSGNLAANWGCYGGGGFTNEVMIGRAGGLQTGTESADHSHATYISGQTGGVSANHTHAVTISGATAQTGGTETRPRNVAMLYCIKY